MPISSIRRIIRRMGRRTKSWSTIVALTLRGNTIERRAKLFRSRSPVLLLYGLGATRRTFSILERRLHNDGYDVFSINLGGLFGTFNTDAIEELARRIDEKIERLYLKYQFRGRLSIISHSKGGLIGHYYVKRLGGENRVKLLVTLGTPHNGNPWCLLASFTPAVLFLKSLRQMIPQSPFIRRLKQGPFPKRTKFYSLYSRSDTVCPFPSAVLEEAPNVKNIEVPGVSHSEFLIKKQAYYIIKHALDDEMPASLEESTRQKVSAHLNAPPREAAHLRLVAGAKSLAFGKK